jgi:transcriptional antiterminator NusG
VSDETLTPEPDGSVAAEALPETPATAVDDAAEALPGEPAAALDDATEEAVEDPNAELLDALQIAPGEWYVVHSYAGYERRVKQNIEVARRNQDLEEEIFQVEVPMETVWEIKKGERKRVERVKLPGYVLVRMEHSPNSWTAIRNTPGVTGFVGHGQEPIPLSVPEVFEMLKGPERPADRKAVEEEAAPGRPAPQVAVSEYNVGDVVTVIDGPFESLQATISEINNESQRITAMVELFGRDTPVELRFDQVTAV